MIREYRRVWVKGYWRKIKLHPHVEKKHSEVRKMGTTIAKSKAYNTAVSKGRKYVKQKKDKKFSVEKRGEYWHTIR